MEERFIVQTSTPERKFIKVYLDFLNAGLLSGKEQIIFIHLKQYINFANDTGTVRGEVYPTLATLAKNVKMSEKTVRTVLQGLQKKGILEIKQQGMNKPNIYKINDSAGMWKAGNAEELRAAVDEIEEKRMIDLLTAKGYYISKEKGLVSDSDQTADTSSVSYNLSKDNNSTNTKKNQGEVAERYPLDYLKSTLCYDDMLMQNQYDRDMIDTFFHYLHEAMNTTKPTIRVNGENKPKETVISVLAKLEYFDFLYAVDKYKENTSKVNNQGAYIITLLYNARAQHEADITNQVQHDMYGQD